jgi:Na+/H+ antiporter NhaD/arsenite permease-like protein
MTVSLEQEWAQSVQGDYFNLIAGVIFFIAVIHAFLAFKISAYAKHWDIEHFATLASSSRKKITHHTLHLLGEVEVVFGFWALVLLLALVLYPGKGWDFMVNYLRGGNLTEADSSSTSKFIEPIFVMVVMIVASTKPILDFTSFLLSRLVNLLGGSPAACWFVILTVGPILGSLITEPAAMTIAALLLSTQFYIHKPSVSLSYATIALLFVNTSVGGSLTHFAAPPIVMVAGHWGWGLAEVFNQFGLASLLTILVSNIFYFSVFRKELLGFKTYARSDSSLQSPGWLIIVHLCFIAGFVLSLAQHQLIYIGILFLVFLAVLKFTRSYQQAVIWRSPILVGFFLAGLVVLGGMQSWWIAPILVRLDQMTLMLSTILLSAFNDNATIAYLAAQVPMMSENTATAASLRQAVISGALAGGGLTVIANAPNLAGQTILSKFFEGGISPVRLVIWALIPTFIAVGCFILVQRFF